ncbi:DNA repair protein RecO [Geitlerinema sp. P-1104]|uniref:DNA repair protein RecO n=1 Tax=Geitlerinema sp. P-1104 TaxID=2546230 RepID=UPI0014777F53|nr:DNA repair protein RecO [Geitlerinema sp. P-1104]NMG57671.1 DNA repair protein RecO [Geitlerinema sp. P-1104]
MYRLTGINLKSMPLGESDRLLTILTPERGLLRVVAAGSRKSKSKFGGRTGLFVLNELMIKPGKTLDRIHHAETLASYPGLSRHFGLLTASQYLAEIALNQALEDSPQPDLFNLLTEHLQRLEQLPPNAPVAAVLAHLCQGIFHLLALGGIAPQVHHCCLSQKPLIANPTQLNPEIGFSIRSGGIVAPAQLQQVQHQQQPSVQNQDADHEAVANQAAFTPTPNRYLNGHQLSLLQQLSQPNLSAIGDSPDIAWIVIEQILRDYTQHHLGRAIRSATLINSYVASCQTQRT